MSRNFNDNAADYINLGDISTARFIGTTEFSFLVFFRVENTAGDDRVILGKENRFVLRIDQGAASQELQVRVEGSVIIEGGSNVALDTWYLGAVTNDGTSSATGMLEYLLTMDGTVLDNAISGDNNLISHTEAIHLGVRAGVDPMDGDIAYAAYFDFELSLAQIKAYLWNPIMFTAQYNANCEFFLPLKGASPEPDWSGNGNNGTVNGSPTISDNPPVSILLPLDFNSSFVIPIAAVGATMNQFQGPNLGADLFNGTLL